MTPQDRWSRITRLHKEAARLIADGRCAAHLDREIAEMEAADRRKKAAA